MRTVVVKMLMVLGVFFTIPVISVSFNLINQPNSIAVGVGFVGVLGIGVFWVWVIAELVKFLDTKLNSKQEA